MRSRFTIPFLAQLCYPLMNGCETPAGGSSGSSVPDPSIEVCGICYTFVWLDGAKSPSDEITLLRRQAEELSLKDICASNSGAEVIVTVDHKGRTLQRTAVAKLGSLGVLT